MRHLQLVTARRFIGLTGITWYQTCISREVLEEKAEEPYNDYWRTPFPSGVSGVHTVEVPNETGSFSQHVLFAVPPRQTWLLEQRGVEFL